MFAQQDRDDQAGPRRPVRDLRRARPPGRRRGPLGFPPPPQAPAGRPGRRVDVVGAQGPGMVDRRPVRHRVTAVRPRRGPRLRQRGRGPLGRRDLLYRLAVLHRGRVPDLPGSRGRRPQPQARPSAVLRLPARRGSTGGPPPCSWPGPCSSTSAPGSRCGPTCPRRPRTSTCGGPTPLARSASWSPARWPGSRPATAGPPGAPGPGPGGSPCST